MQINYSFYSSVLLWMYPIIKAVLRNSSILPY